MRFAIILLALISTALGKEYEAKVIEVTDGDTVIVEIALGLDVSKKEHARLLGIDAPEMNTDEGKKAKEYLERKIKNKSVTILTKEDKREKYGRLLCEIILEERNVNKLMIERGFAKEYDGGKR